MATIQLICQISFRRENVPRLATFLRETWRSSFVLPYTFQAYHRPTFFDLWCRCPTVMLCLPGEKKPFLDLNASLMSLPVHVFEAHEWRPEYTEIRVEFKKRCADEMMKNIAKQMDDLRAAYARLTDRRVQLTDYMEKLERGIDDDLPLFDN